MPSNSWARVESTAIDGRLLVPNRLRLTRRISASQVRAPVLLAVSCASRAWRIWQQYWPNEGASWQSSLHQVCVALRFLRIRAASSDVPRAAHRVPY